MSEWAFIERLRQQVAADARVQIGIGDDAALLQTSPSGMLVAKDMLLDGVHFQSETQSLQRIGHKALAVNLSDIAAMGGWPEAAFVALALPRHWTNAQCDALMQGILELAARFAVTIAGGDTNVWDGPLVVSITVTGRAHARGPVIRSGAKAGDLILVTGALGGSISGHHLDFIPRLEAARTLLDAGPIHSMIDLSDGLATDLRHLLKASGLGAALLAKALPLSPALALLEPEVAVDKAIGDGEDFELCLTVDPHLGHEWLRANPIAPIPLTAIGYCQEGSGFAWELENGAQIPISKRGYEHGS